MRKIARTPAAARSCPVPVTYSDRIAHCIDFLYAMTFKCRKHRLFRHFDAFHQGVEAFVAAFTDRCGNGFLRPAQIVCYAKLLLNVTVKAGNRIELRAARDIAR